MPKYFWALLFTAVSVSCNRQVENENTICAIVGSDTIFLEEVDDRIKQQLYLQLHQVYQMRKIATGRLIEEKLIELEAKRLNIDPDSVISAYITRHSTEEDLQRFIERNNLESGVSDLKKDLKYFDVNSNEGQQALQKSFSKNLRRQLIAELKDTYPSSTFLVPPPQPLVELDDLLLYYKGASSSKVTVTVVSDFECDNCRNFAPKFDSLYHKYGDKIRFAFTNHSSYIGLASMAAAAAAQQDKFWEMHDLIFKTDINYRDTADFLKLAASLQMDIPEFQHDLKDSSIYELIIQNIETIKNYGIMGTPTVIVNKRIVINSSQTSEIENTINEELKINQIN